MLKCKKGKNMAKKIQANLDTGTLFFELLFLLFLGLKLGNVIDWSWWWVFAPLWVPLALVVVIIGVMFIALVITGGAKNAEKNKK